MKAYKVSEARAKFGTLLDEAEGGDVVIVERNGIRFHIAVQRRSRARASTRRKAPFTFVDPDVLSGTWTWTLGRRGLSFRSRRSRS